MNTENNSKNLQTNFLKPFYYSLKKESDELYKLKITNFGVFEGNLDLKSQNQIFQNIERIILNFDMNYLSISNNKYLNIEGLFEKYQNYFDERNSLILRLNQILISS